MKKLITLTILTLFATVVSGQVKEKKYTSKEAYERINEASKEDVQAIDFTWVTIGLQSQADTALKREGIWQIEANYKPAPEELELRKKGIYTEGIYTFNANANNFRRILFRNGTVIIQQQVKRLTPVQREVPFIDKVIALKQLRKQAGSENLNDSVFYEAAERLEGIFVEPVQDTIIPIKDSIGIKEIKME